MPLKVYVSVNDNNSVITSVLLYIDNKSYAGTSEFPYNFTIKAGELDIGTYTIKAIVRNKDGKQGETSVKITVKEANYESPDFVSFSDGKLPKGWEADGWHVTPTNGFDDFFSLFTNHINTKAKASKTCDYIEFYATGSGRYEFYLDGEMLSSSIIASTWRTYSFSFPCGFHTFEWVVVQSLKGLYLDAIKFETKTE